MFLRFNGANDLESKIHSSFSFFRETLMKLHKKMWNDEGLRGTSTVQYTIYQYYIALLIVLIIYEETKYRSADWSFYVSKYGLVNLKKILGCNNVRLETILTSVGLPPVIEENTITDVVTAVDFEIGVAEIGTSFEVDPPEELDPLSVLEGEDIAFLLNTELQCEIYVTYPEDGTTIGEDETEGDWYLDEFYPDEWY